MSTRLHAPRAHAAPAARKAATAALVALGVAALVTGLLLLVSYGFAAEYGDTAAPMSRTAFGALTGGAVVIALVVALCVAAIVKTGGRRGARTTRSVAVVLVLATVAGTPAAAVLGTRVKFERYTASPDCVDGFRAGPAGPVVQAAQAAFEEVEHPGPFGGGGSAGIDGCETEVMVREDADVLGGYQTTLPAAGWRVIAQSGTGLRAVKGEQAFEVRMADYGWVVWAGPRDLRRRTDLPEGTVAPRR